MKWEFYRVRASLNAPLQAKDYPFAVIDLPISIELLLHDYDVNLVWLENQTGIDAGFVNVGWNTPTYTLSTANNSYPAGFTSPRVDMTILQSRSAYFSFAVTILPPPIFCLVSGVSYLFKMEEKTAFSLRVGIHTSMLITAVLYNINQQNSIPPISELTLYTAFIDAVFVFSCNKPYRYCAWVRGWFKTRNRIAVDRLNFWGFLASIVAPLIIFLVLFLII